MSAWSLGQAWTQTAQVSTATTTITGPAASVTGRVLVLWIWYSGSGITVSSITDNATTANTYTVQGTANIGAAGLTVAIATTVISHIPASGSMTITATLSAAPTLYCLAAAEYNGQSSGTLIDPVSILQDTNNGWIEELITSTYSDALYITGTYSNNNTTITASTGWTLRGNNSTGQAAADSLGGGLGNVVGPPLQVTNTNPNTSAVSFAILASDSVLVGKNSPVATPAGSPPDQYCRGVFGLSTVDEPNPSSLPYWTQNNLMGFAARFSWAALEPTEGNFNWTPIDAVLSLAQTNNKYVSIGVLTNPGPSSGVTKQPSWLGSSTQGACSTYTYWNAANTASTAGYAPWDPIFQYYIQRFIDAFGRRYDGNPYISYIAIDSGVGDGEANITKGTNGLAQLNALGGVPIWVSAMENGYWLAYFSVFRKTQIIFVTGAPVPGDTTTMPSMLSYGSGAYGSQFGFKSDGLVANTAPSDFFNAYVVSHPIAFQFSQTGSVPDSQFAAVMANGFTLGGDITKLGGIAFEIYKSQATGSANIQNVLSLYNSLLFYNGNNPIVPNAFLPRTWASNGSQTGGSGPYSPGTQSVQFLHDNFAIAGDTITLPSGTFSWSGNCTITKAITVQGLSAGAPPTSQPYGAGTLGCTIQSNLVTGQLLNLTNQTSATGHITLTGIYFLQIANNAGANANVMVMASRDMGTSYTVLINNCYFDSGTISSYGLNTAANGIIIWSCTLSGNPSAPSLAGVSHEVGTSTMSGTFVGPGAWNAASTMGNLDTTGLNNTYIERCYFLNSAGSNSDDNSRVVLRFSTFQDGPAYAHGQDTSEWGPRHLEIYSNNFNNVNAGTLNLQSWVFIRGATFVCFNNVMQAPPAGKASFGVACQNINRGGSLGGCQTGYPANRQVGSSWSSSSSGTYGNPVVTQDGTGYFLEPGYAWNNTGSGGQSTMGSAWWFVDSYWGDFGFTSGGDPCGNSLLSTFTFTCNIASGNNQLTSVTAPQLTYGGNASPTSPNSMQVGMGIYDPTGTYIPLGTYVTAKGTGTLNLSGNALANGTGITLTSGWLTFGRDFIIGGTSKPGYSSYTYPHPLTSGVNITPGSGLTADADAKITNTVVGSTTGAYPVPLNNYAALFSTQFTAQAKAGAIELTTSGGYSTYARQPMGASAAGWTIAAYASGTGVVWKNANAILFPAVPSSGSPQTLFSLGWYDALTGGNIGFFIDSASSVTIPIGISVYLPASTGSVFTSY